MSASIKINRITYIWFQVLIVDDVMQRLVVFLTVLAPFFLALGITLPLVRFEKFYFFEDAPSLISMILILWQENSFVLAILISLFSVVFPVVKLFVVTAEVVENKDTPERKSSKYLPMIARWSMMDVMLVALVIVAAKTSGMANAFTQPGLWFYAFSALAATFVHWAVQRTK